MRALTAVVMSVWYLYYAWDYMLTEICTIVIPPIPPAGLFTSEGGLLTRKPIGVLHNVIVNLVSKHKRVICVT